VQSEIIKSFELRVTVIGHSVFAVSIDSQSSELTRTDWRPHAELCKHQIFELPQKIHDFCIAFLNNFELEFGAFDFIVDCNGEYVFLECNPFGQYLWTEYETGAKITQAILDYFIDIDNSHEDTPYQSESGSESVT
jgi:glutathione synthase/RimK-type ligase-like ATP-grasp enzyme